MTLGFDVSGTVVAVGSGVKDLAVGDAVFGFLPGGGGFAEYVKIKPNAIVKRGAIPAKDAGAYGVAYGTAWQALFMAHDITKAKGQSIYIPGGSGGVGHFAVQLAKAAGLTVYSSGSKPDSAALATKMGVDVYIDYSKQDVTKEILSATNGKGVNIVWDATYSTDSYKQSAGVVAKDGHWMRLGDMIDATEAISIVKSRGGHDVVTDYGRYWVNPQYINEQPKLHGAFNQAVGYYTSGKVRPQVTLVIPINKGLAEAVAANGKGKLGAGKQVVEVSKA